MRPRALMLAVDGLDWTRLQFLVDARRLPCIAQLMESGAQGRLAPGSAWLHGAAAWTAAATGRWPDRHGVCHDLSPRPDGLRLEPVDAAAVQAPTLWDRVHGAGGQAWCLAWPATLPPPGTAQPPGLARCAAGFEEAAGATAECWPLAPGSAWPASLRGSLHASRVHPLDLALPDFKELLPPGSHHPHGPLFHGARRLLARWASVQAAGVAWAGETGWQLLALRLDGLQHWARMLRALAPAMASDTLDRAYQWLDLLVGRYMHLLGRGTVLALLSDGDGVVAGGVVLAGPGVPQDALLQAPRLVDVAPTLGALLGLPADAASDGRDLLAASASPVGMHGAGNGFDAACAPGGAAARLPVAPDTRALAWLAAQGVPLPNGQALRRPARAVRVAALSVWATAREARGLVQEAVAALRDALQTDPGAHLVRLHLGRLLVLEGHVEECRGLLHGLPEPLRQPPWTGLWEGLIAFGERDWAQARRQLAPLEGRAEIPANLAAWVGWSCLLDGDAQAAQAVLQRAVTQGDALAWAWEGLAWAQYRLGHARAAAQAFSRAIALQPRSARLQLGRAVALEAAGDHAAAQAGYWHALALDPQLQAARLGLLQAGRRQLGLDRSATWRALERDVAQPGPGPEAAQAAKT